MSDSKWNTEKLDTGERTALKRNAGVMYGNDVRAMEAFWHAAGYVPTGKENIWFACLCMECLWKSEDHAAVLPFEEILKRLYQNGETSESIKNRMIAMLDVPWAPDGYLLGKLNNFARIFRSKNAAVMPDFQQLADDLSNWDRPEHWVQRRWIKTICGNKENEEEKETEENENVD